MKEDIKWLRRRLEVHRKETMQMWEQSEPYSAEKRHFSINLSVIEEVFDFLDGLGEQEVLSQEWIDEHTTYADLRGAHISL